MKYCTMKELAQRMVIKNPNGFRSIQNDNLKDASRYAEQDLKDRWEWYKERFIKKLKKNKNDKQGNDRA